ncbi:MAG: response regulator [Anaerolineae bacterium]|nr:response regulator [Anaerolineae bacterium]
MTPEQPLALVIEDHKQQALVFQKALETAGFVTEMITDGETAQQRLTEVVPHLITLDLHMPGVSGEMLLAQIRADERFANTHVFLATADALLADKLRKDAKLVLLKPVGFSQLASLAKKFLPKS